MLKILILLIFFVAAQSKTFFKTPYGNKFHLYSCRMVKNVSHEITPEKARELGLQPCKICIPQLINNPGTAVPHKAKGQNSTVQCKGYTKSGTRCKHMTSIANGYCFQHIPG